MAKLRVHAFSISLDGYGAGPNQGLENPLGVGGEQLHEWMFRTRSERQLGGGERLFDGLDDLPTGYELSELVCSPAVAHVRVTKR